MLFRSCPVAATTQLFAAISVVPFASEKCLPQPEHVQYALLPAVVHVAAFAAVAVRLCPVAGMDSVRVWLLSFRQVNVRTPALVQVAGVVIVPSSQLCPVAVTT